MADDAVMGIDAGGSSTRVVLQQRSGRLVAHVVTAGGNHHSSSEDLLTRLAEAVGRALQLAGGPPVVASAAGLAGAGSAAGDEVRQRVTTALARHGVHCPTLVGTDLDIAFRAAAPGLDGALLLAGTGAVAAGFRDGRQVRRCDGLGWRLGDEGSGWWIGSSGLRAAVAAVDGRGPTTELSTSMAQLLGVSAVTGDPRQDWVRAVAGAEAPALARLAPAVLAGARAQDAVAVEIVTEAARRLLRSLTVAIGEDPWHDVVLAGGVLLADSPLRQLVSDELEAQHRVAHRAPHPVLGALQMARESMGWEPAVPVDVVEALER